MGRQVPYEPGFMGLVTASRLVIAGGMIAVWCGVFWTRRYAWDRYRHGRSALREQRERVS
ncbi:hypothetical protein [Streptomyces sp. NPDC050759]|uniref:hypothetical protein n=1 Tax=Streptomyces sp. NPDC050759 TaxID=3365635 RepID=UPI00379DA3CC